MRFFYCLISLSCIFVKYSLANNYNNYIPCTSRCSHIQLPFLNATKFPATCQSDDNSALIYNDGLLCTVHYSIDYTAKSINIDFQATNDTSMINDKYSGEYLIQEITLNITEFSSRHFTTSRRYGCTSNKDCAREFYLNTIHDLVTTGFKELRDIKKKLNKIQAMVGESSKRQCSETQIDGHSNAKLCKNGLCYADYENYTFNRDRKKESQSCDMTLDQFVYSSIEYHSPQQPNREKETLKYRCNKNMCNRDGMVHIIQGMIANYTRWNPAITRDDIIVNIKRDSNSSIPQTLSSSIVVLFLMLIQLFI